MVSGLLEAFPFLLVGGWYFYESAEKGASGDHWPFLVMILAFIALVLSRIYRELRDLRKLAERVEATFPAPPLD